MPYYGFAIVDDDQLFRHILKAQISKVLENQQVITFENGNQALNYLDTYIDKPEESQIPRVIFLDINMPIMNGWQFLDGFKKLQDRIQEEITIYMITSSVDRRDEQKADSYSEISKFVVKPITSDQLREILKEGPIS